MNLSLVLTGKSREHLVPLPNAVSPQHALQAEVVTAFLGLQQAAKAVGFNLQPASTYRDFARQQAIWNGKFSGERKVLDSQEQEVNIALLDDWQKCRTILHWSAVAGASRHHWGTEIDIFDPDLLPSGQSLQLEAWEYQTGGYFAELSDWLQQNMAQFGFYLPFVKQNGKKIGVEPWHISFRPLSDRYQRLFTAEMLQNAWENEPICGKNCLIDHIDELFKDYIL